MPDDVPDIVLRRMLVPPRRAKGAAPGTVDDCLRIVFPRSADEVLALSLEVLAIGMLETDEAGVLEALEEGSLNFLMKNEAGDLGLCSLDAGLVAAIIEVQLTGRVSPAPATERAATRTDAIVVSDMVDCWISACTEAAIEGEFSDVMPLEGFHRLDTTLDKRAAALTLDPGQYETLRLTMSLDGAKEGVLAFHLPRRVEAPISTGPSHEEALRAQLLELPAAMEAILARVRLPLSEVLKFAPGDHVPVPIEALQNMFLEGDRGKRIVSARLGQLQGNRAVLVRSGGTTQPRVASQTEHGLARINVDVAPSLPSAGEDNQSLEPKDSTEDVALITDIPNLPNADDLSVLPQMPELPRLEDVP